MKHYRPRINVGRSMRHLSSRWLNTVKAFLSFSEPYMTSLCVRGLGLLRVTALPCTTAKATPNWIFCFPPSNLKRSRKLEMLARVRAFSVVSSLTRYSGHCLAFRPLSLNRLFSVKSQENGMKELFKSLYVTICRNSRMLERSARRFVSMSRKSSMNKAERLIYGRI